MAGLQSESDHDYHDEFEAEVGIQDLDNFEEIATKLGCVSTKCLIGLSFRSELRTQLCNKGGSGGYAS